MQADRKAWGRGTSHERKVEAFYGQGVGNITAEDFRGGFLSFGYWADGTEDYVEAAKRLVDEMAKRLGMDGKSRLCDVACGMGAQDLYLMQTAKPAVIEAVDVTWPHVRGTRERMDREGWSHRVRAHHGTAVALPFGGGTFTHLMSIEGPEHFDTREAFMREAFRVLRPGGVMVLSDYLLEKDPRTFAEKLLVGFVGWLWRVPRENHDTEERYRAKLEKAGFRDVTVERVGKDVIPGYYFSHARPEERERISRLRGWKTRLFGGLIDWGVYKTFTTGMVEYVFVRAVKP